MRSILIVEDDAAVARGLLDNLEYEGLAVRHAATGEEGIDLLRAAPSDLLLLDLMLPGMNGFDVLRAVGEAPPPHPRTIVVSARDAEADVVRALDLGAHDYVKKPFGLSELLARVRAQLRELDGDAAPAPAELAFGDVRVSLRRFRLWKGGREHLLSHLEAGMLRLFAARPDEPLSRAEILREAWGEDTYPSERTVDNFVLKLRRKIEDDPKSPRYLRTVHRLGYRFTPQG